MASGDFVLSSRVKIREGDVGVNRPVSEAVNQKIAGSINALIDSSFYALDIFHNGYFSNAGIFRSPPLRIERLTTIASYQMAIGLTGNSGSTTFNISVYDANGTFINNVFGSSASRCLISGSNGTNVIVGANVDESTNFSINTSGHSFQYGNLNLTQFQEGYFIVPFIENASQNARALRFLMKLREE